MGQWVLIGKGAGKFRMNASTLKPNKHKNSSPNTDGMHHTGLGMLQPVASGGLAYLGHDFAYFHCSLFGQLWKMNSQKSFRLIGLSQSKR